MRHAEAWPAAAHTVLALGHNPGWEDAQSRLSGRWETMTTANVALLQGHGSTWVEALAGGWSLEAFGRPKEI